MRQRLLTSLVVVVSVTFSVASAHQAPSPKRGVEAAAEMSAMIEQLVQSLFTTADANHNRYLNKREFENAETALAAAVNDWGRQGLIGNAKRQNKTEKGQTNENSANAIGARLAKNNRVSQPEFAIYVHAVVEQADHDWREARTTADAQRRAYNQYRAYYRPRRGWMPVPQP